MGLGLAWGLEFRFWIPRLQGIWGLGLVWGLELKVYGWCA